MRLMVTGGAGVIGSQLCTHLRAKGHEVIPVDIASAEGVVCADLQDEASARGVFEKYCPAAVLHLAANKNVFFCEENPDVAHATNFGMTETLAQLCAEFGSRMIFFSSDYVFGNEDRIWCEKDAPCPTTQYGRDKVASEQVIQKQLADYAVVRTAGLYGFSGDLVHVVRSVLSKGEAFNAFDNLTNCPTSLGDLFQMLDIILDGALTGIFHCVGPEALSRFDYARSVARAFGLDVSLIQAESLEFSHDVRPSSLRLDGSRAYKQMGVMPGTLLDNLRKMIDE